MARVITFSRVFPAYHPNKGMPTYFVERFIRSFTDGTDYESEHLDYYCELMADYNFQGLQFAPKGHTIRSGKRWKVGDYFSPRFWSDKPYRSPMVIFSPNIKIEKIYDIEIKGTSFFINENQINYSTILDLATNDGLDLEAFFKWFKLSEKTNFSGQIIVWDKSINY